MQRVGGGGVCVEGRDVLSGVGVAACVDTGALCHAHRRSSPKAFEN